MFDGARLRRVRAAAQELLTGLTQALPQDAASNALARAILIVVVIISSLNKSAPSEPGGALNG